MIGRWNGMPAIRYTCTNMGCSDEATAEVLVGATYLPKCFTHEREYADRYGCAEVRPLREESARS